MIDEQLLGLIRCPVTRSRLHPADNDVLNRLNQAIAAGQVVDRTGHQVAEPLQAALVNADGNLMYAVNDGIPSLVGDEAIPLGQLDASAEKGPSDA